MGLRSLLQGDSARPHPCAHSLGKHCRVLPWPQSWAPSRLSVPSYLAPSLPSKGLSVDHVTMLLGQNVGDLQKARSHPTVSSWLRSLNRLALDKLGLDTDPASPASPTGPVPLTTGTHDTTLWASHLAATSGGSGSDAPSSGTASHPGLPLGRPSPASARPCLPRASVDPKPLLIPNVILHWPTFSTGLLGDI